MGSLLELLALRVGDADEGRLETASLGSLVGASPVDVWLSSSCFVGEGGSITALPVALITLHSKIVVVFLLRSKTRRTKGNEAFNWNKN